MDSILKKFGQVCAVIGGQWGDEGKGKLVDILAEHYDIIVRATGGANAGHTIYRGDDKFVFHLVPSGMFHKGKMCVMGNGMVIHIPTLLEEMKTLEDAGARVKGRLFLSDRTHLVFDFHKTIDRLQEEMKGGAKVGTTGRGIGPAYTDKISRIGIRVAELADFKKFEERYLANLSYLQKIYRFEHDADAELCAIKKALPQILPLIIDTNVFFSKNQKKSFLLEGANGTLLDIDHGTYPFVTSSNASISGIISGTGIAPSRIKSAIGIMKAYVTRVGSGPFPTELHNKLGERIREIGAEFGATTGRPRRCGWFDAVGARYAVQLNGFTGINLTKLDVLTGLPSIKIGVEYTYKGKPLPSFPADTAVLAECKIRYEEFPGWKEDISKAKSLRALPKNCQRYVLAIEKRIGCPIQFIGTGRRSEEMIGC